jgi:hypothetical protein
MDIKITCISFVMIINQTNPTKGLYTEYDFRLWNQIFKFKLFFKYVEYKFFLWHILLDTTLLNLVRKAWKGQNFPITDIDLLFSHKVVKKLTHSWVFNVECSIWICFILLIIHICDLPLQKVAKIAVSTTTKSLNLDSSNACGNTVQSDCWPCGFKPCQGLAVVSLSKTFIYLLVPGPDLIAYL